MSKMKYFHFGVWSISYNCLHDTARTETPYRCFFIAVILTEMKKNLGEKISSKQCLKRNHIKGNICACVSKNYWLLFNGPFISDHPRNEILFISPAMKINVERVPFMMGQNFISGLM